MQTVTYTLPSFWLYALEYGPDEAGFSDEDEKAFESFRTYFEKEHGPEKGFSYTDEDGNTKDAGFMRYHDAQPFGVLACDCLEITFLVGCAESV